MSIFYTSKRIGKGGKEFTYYKFRTLKAGADKESFANGQSYTLFGKFLRKTKLDEFPALLNVLKGDIGIFGYRPEEKRTWDIYPKEIQDMLAKQKPGLVDLASVHFFNEESMLQMSQDSYEAYYHKIFPMKMTLRAFYFENKCWPLKLAIIWIVVKKMLKSLLK